MRPIHASLAQARILHALTALAAACALAACASSPDTAGGMSSMPSSSSSAGATRSALSSASANLSAASGSLASGKLMLMPMGDGVHVTGEVGGLKANGTHAFHIHEKGDCSAADASSAGAHFNPAAQPHGRQSAPKHHAGDHDNLVANAEGVAKIDAHFRGVVLGGGASNDVAGKAVVVHADPDDYTSQPAGNAGSRIACGVIR